MMFALQRLLQRFLPPPRVPQPVTEGASA